MGNIQFWDFVAELKTVTTVTAGGFMARQSPVNYCSKIMHSK